MYCYGYLGSRLLFLGISRSISKIEAEHQGYTHCFTSDVWHDAEMRRPRL